MIIVDSSVLIDFLRGLDTDAVAHLVRLEQDAVPYALPAVCLQEVLQGAKDEAEWEQLRTYLETQWQLLPEEPLATHRNAARIYFDCRRRGITLRSTIDCFIAQLALEYEGTLLHDDRDYEKIRQVRPLRTLPG